MRNLVVETDFDDEIELAGGPLPTLRHDFINGSVVNASLATRPSLSAVSHQAPGEVHQRSPSEQLFIGGQPCIPSNDQFRPKIEPREELCGNSSAPMVI